jgi:hypothetical protein
MSEEPEPPHQDPRPERSGYPGKDHGFKNRPLGIGVGELFDKRAHSLMIMILSIEERIGCPPARV